MKDEGAGDVGRAGGADVRIVLAGGSGGDAAQQGRVCGGDALQSPLQAGGGLLDVGRVPLQTGGGGLALGLFPVGGDARLGGGHAAVELGDRVGHPERGALQVPNSALRVGDRSGVTALDQQFAAR